MNKAHLTVGDIIDALSRYDRDRIVGVGSGITSYRPLKQVGSIEPDGVVILVEDFGGRLDPHTLEWISHNR
jgi:ribose 5-phosphate isomerase